MKKLLLVAPPFYRLMGSHYNGLHLGIAYIAAILKKHGHQVCVYNADYYNTPEYLNQKQLFDNYASYKAILNDFANPIWDEIRSTISDFAPDFVGIAMMTANYKAARNIASIAKSFNAGIKIIVGGAHPTMDAEGTLAEKEFDYIIRGEGEFSMLELINGEKESSIKGLSFKKDNQQIHNEERAFIQNLDSLPFPSRDSFLNNNEHLDVGYLSTGRGCPFSCAYCASPKLWHGITRFRSVTNVMSELEHLQKHYHPPIIHFVDDTFTLNKHRAKELCQQIIDRKLGISWVCDTRVDCLDEEMAALMKNSGCVRIKIGVESGSDRVLASIRKGTSTAEIRRAVRLIKKHGIPLTVYLMVGFPGETNEDLRQTIEFAKELEADYYSLSVLAPYYGTQVWNEMENSGKKLDREHWEYFYHQSHDMPVNDGLDPNMIDKFFALNEQGKGERV